MAKQQRLRAAPPSVRPSAGAGTPNLLIATALKSHKAGRLAEAEPLYREALRLDGDNVTGLHLLGLCLVAAGRQGEAVEPLGHAARLQPERVDLNSDFGAALRATGRLAEARAAFERAVAADAGHAAALRNLVSLLLDAGDTAAAAAALRRHLETRPADPMQALAFADRIAALGDRAAALDVFRLAAELRPADADVRDSIGVLLLSFGSFAEALDAFDAAIARNPKHANAHCNRGIALYRLGRPEEALAAYETAVACDPACAPALTNIGSFHADRDDVERALAAYRRAVAVRPDLTSALFELCNQRRYACDWNGLDEDQARLDAIVARDDVRLPPFPSLFTKSTPAEQLRVARRWANGLGIRPADVLPPVWRQPAPGERIRIGYISGDFYQHATATLVAELFERHDRSRFELYGYAYGRNDDSPMRRRLEAAFDHFVDVGGLGDAAAARRIRQDGIDILVDLKGYSRGARPEILALRPAPVQVNYLTYPATMGADFIDYIVVDDIIAPPEHQPFYAERLVHLPGSYQPNDNRRAVASEAPSRAECGLPDGAFVFCSFNNNYKITPEIFSIWMRLLEAVPDSVLWLLEASAIARESLQREAAARGVDPQRLVFAARAALPVHLARHRHADLFLDTLPVNAHTTASDALWVGLPVVTCAGDSLVARVAASLLYAVGLPELVTTSLDDYEQVALALAQDRELLGIVKARLAANLPTAALFDIAGYTGKLEAAYLHMHGLRLAGRPPEPFALAAGGAEPSVVAAVPLAPSSVPAASAVAAAAAAIASGDDWPAPPLPEAAAVAATGAPVPKAEAAMEKAAPVQAGPAQPAAAKPHAELPTVLNLGCGDGADPGAFNIDADERTSPDAVLDLSTVDVGADGLAVETSRFGAVRLRPGTFQRIVAGEILGRVADLPRLMSNCLALLEVGGVIEAAVPYDLSLRAWRDPRCVRAFNEGSFAAYTEDFARLGWREARFDIDAVRHAPTALGAEMLAAGRPIDEVLRTPRAIEAMLVVLRKLALAPEQPTVADAPPPAERPASTETRRPAAGAHVVDVALAPVARKATATAAAPAGAPAPVPAGPAGPARHAFPGGWAAHRDRHCVWIVSPDGYPHHHAFDEVAEALSEAFAELGGSAPLVRHPQDWNGRVPIVFGANLLPADAALPEGSVLVNLEQVDRSSSWLSGAYVSLLKRFPVLDYSARNRDALVAAGVPRVDLLEIGYAPALRRIAMGAEPDIDVLFYGSLNERRSRVLGELKARGLTVAHLFGVYGAERDATVGRAKLVLNLHFYDAAVFEIVRVSYLLANRVCVVSEGDPADPDLAPFAGGIAVAPYGGLVERCVALAADPAARQAIAARGFEAFSARRQASLLRDAVAAR